MRLALGQDTARPAQPPLSPWYYIPLGLGIVLVLATVMKPRQRAGG